MTRLVNEIAHEKGALSFLALFLREGFPDRWDVVIAAPWADADTTAARLWIVKRYQASLPQKELFSLDKIVVIPTDEPELADAHRYFPVVSTMWEVRDEVFFGLEVERGYIIVSRALTDQT